MWSSDDKNSLLDREKKIFTRIYLDTGKDEKINFDLDKTFDVDLDQKVI